MRAPRVLMAATILAAGLGIVYVLGRPQASTGAEEPGLAAALDPGVSGYSRAERMRRFRFPRDHGPHPSFRHEWWYFTGNLTGDDGRRFGYELTIFRIALSPVPPDSQSSWATNQLYWAHLAFTDRQVERFRFFERFGRGALGLAGARAVPFAVWLEDWTVMATTGTGFPWRLTAAADGLALDLELSPAKPLVLHGEQGLDRKSAEGHASYYYSYTRLETAGALRLGGEKLAVQGSSWLDREWGSGMLAKDQQGWDWFALQLDNGGDLMFYQLRKADGSKDPHSGGTWVPRHGPATTLAHDDVQIKALARWDSPRGGTYPARWRLSLPQRDCRFMITPILSDQELDVSVRYWEGAVDVRGACGGEDVAGWGYVELTGYAEPS